MGEPAEMTPAEREIALRAAHLIYTGVLNDESNPVESLHTAAEEYELSKEVVCLWLATMTLQAGGLLKAQQDFSASHVEKPTGLIEHDEAMARAREARALYGKPSKAVRVRIDRGDFQRVAGSVLCETCQVAYVDHDPVIGFPWLRHGCDGRLLKP